MRPLTLAYSPCPNDTFIFGALANGWLPDAPSVSVTLDDVEALNDAALNGTYDVTKVSYAAVPELLAHFRLLRSGGALGYNCGPLLVAREDDRAPLAGFRDARIAIPGRRTTAFLLLRLALNPAGPVREIRFDRIAEAVKAGEVDAGLIIHEARFTYSTAGLVQIADLGEWWAQETGLPIPLGAILARRDLSDDRVQSIENAIRSSLEFAREHEEQVLDYVRTSTSETSDDVIRRHIELYVNTFSVDVGDDGEAAVRELFRRAHLSGYAATADVQFA